VSVVLITYNHEPYIAQCLDGLLMQQTAFPVEILIGEDCSTDRTREICAAYAQAHPEKVRLVISEENIGGGRNFLRALGAAVGTYVAYCDGDDYWSDPAKLQKQVDYLEANPECAICFHAVEIIDADDPANRQICRPFPEDRVLTLAELLLGNFIVNCSTMFRRALFPEFPDWYLTLPQGDWSLGILNAQYGDIGYLDQVMAVYRQHRGGRWSGLTAVRQCEVALASYDAFAGFLDDRYQADIKAGMAYCYWRQLAVYGELGDMAKLKAVLRKASFILRHHPKPRPSLGLAAVALRCYLPPLYCLLRRVKNAVQLLMRPGRCCPKEEGR
jgi:glycosyltransferase involved in cell wall biosynthesis